MQEQQAREERSQRAFASAQAQNTNLGGRVKGMNTAVYGSALQSIINDLDQVEPRTTVYDAAQQLRQAVQSRLKEVAAQS